MFVIVPQTGESPSQLERCLEGVDIQGEEAQKPQPPSQSVSRDHLVNKMQGEPRS